MSDERDTDLSAVVPPAAPLVGDPADPDQPDPSEVFPSGEASENDHLVAEEQRRRDDQA